jgi:hypothetical protein
MKALAILFSLPLWAADFTAPDGSYRFAIPAGWHARYSPLMTVLEPTTGGEQRILVGSGISAASSIREMAQQAVGLSAVILPGLRVTAGPRFSGHTAEQEYANAQFAAWNGMRLQGETYLAVMTVGRPANAPQLQPLGRAILESAKFQPPPRNTLAEQQILGRWELSSYKSSRTGTTASSSYSSNWTVVFSPGNRFQSTQQSHFDTRNDSIGGGNVGAAAQASGTYRIFGASLVADLDGGGRQIFAIEPYTGDGLKLNGMLFLRQ